jgi:predicted amidohydrolase
MARYVRLTAVQPPFPDKVLRNADMLKVAHELVDQAGSDAADIVLLPELINTYEINGIDADVMKMAAPEVVQALKASFGALARKHHMYLILPVGEARGDSLYNSAILLGRDGKEIGRYDKTHISQPELLLYPQIKAGNSFPVFELDFGRIAIMTCYDCNFPEVAIIYAMKGADVLFYPRWQSGPSEIFFEIQMRARALDHAIFLVSSSFGVRDGIPWKPGMLFGRSCVIGRDGTILADASHEQGLASTKVDLDRPRLVECLDESQGQGLVKELGELIRQDRRPDLYREVLEQEILNMQK